MFYIFKPHSLLLAGLGHVGDMWLLKGGSSR